MHFEFQPKGKGKNKERDKYHSLKIYTTVLDRRLQTMFVALLILLASFSATVTHAVTARTSAESARVAAMTKNTEGLASAFGHFYDELEMHLDQNRASGIMTPFQHERAHHAVKLQRIAVKKNFHAPSHVEPMLLEMRAHERNGVSLGDQQLAATHTLVDAIDEMHDHAKNHHEIMRDHGTALEAERTLAAIISPPRFRATTTTKTGGKWMKKLKSGVIMMVSVFFFSLLCFSVFN